MFLKLSVPSKTFLIGEYFITQNGAALIANTAPSFELILRESSNNKSSGINPDSPAGNYLQANIDVFANSELEFNDPHQSQGGLGASSAQFLMLYAAKHYLNKEIVIPQQLLETYWQYCWQEKGIKPSGADIISQLSGNITYFNASSQKIEKYLWPFKEINFYLLRTNNKLTTHEHLRSDLKLDVTGFSKIMHDAMLSFTTANEKSFIQCINNYQAALAEQNLVDDRTQELLNVILKDPCILAAKGCGALGADVIVVFTQSRNEGAINRVSTTLNLPIIASNLQLGAGLQMK